MGSNSAKAYAAETRKDLLFIHPDKLVVVTDKAHVLYDERVHLPLDPAFVADIAERGILEPIMARPNGEDGKGNKILEVIFGRQRVRAAREANRTYAKRKKDPVLVPVLICRGTDQEMLEMMTVENEHRVQSDPMLRAVNMQRCLTAGMTEERCAHLHRCDTSTVRNTVRLLDLHPRVAEAVTQGQIGATLASKHLAKLPREEQVPALTKLVASGRTKGAAAADAVRRIREGRTEGPAPSRMMARRGIEELRRQLAKSDVDGAQTACAVLAHVLGHPEALRAHPALAAAIGAQSGEGAGKRAASSS